MSDEITPEVFAQMVDLAAIALDPTQAEYLRSQLNNQLRAIHELEAIPLSDDITITSHGVPYTAETSPEPREDIWQPYPNTAAILAQIPVQQDGYVIVPDIPHTTLD